MLLLLLLLAYRLQSHVVTVVRNHSIHIVSQVRTRLHGSMTVLSCLGLTCLSLSCDVHRTPKIPSPPQQKPAQPATRHRQQRTVTIRATPEVMQPVTTAAAVDLNESLNDSSVADSPAQRLPSAREFILPSSVRGAQVPGQLLFHDDNSATLGFAVIDEGPGLDMSFRAYTQRTADVQSALPPGEADAQTLAMRTTSSRTSVYPSIVVYSSGGPKVEITSFAVVRKSHRTQARVVWRRSRSLGDVAVLPATALRAMDSQDDSKRRRLCRGAVVSVGGEDSVGFKYDTLQHAWKRMIVDAAVLPVLPPFPIEPLSVSPPAAARSLRYTPVESLEISGTLPSTVAHPRTPSPPGSPASARRARYVSQVSPPSLGIMGTVSLPTSPLAQARTVTHTVRDIQDGAAPPFRYSALPLVSGDKRDAITVDHSVDSTVAATEAVSLSEPQPMSPAVKHQPPAGVVGTPIAIKQRPRPSSPHQDLSAALQLDSNAEKALRDDISIKTVSDLSELGLNIDLGDLRDYKRPGSPPVATDTVLSTSSKRQALSRHRKQPHRPHHRTTARQDESGRYIYDRPVPDDVQLSPTVASASISVPNEVCAPCYWTLHSCVPCCHHWFAFALAPCLCAVASSAPPAQARVPVQSRRRVIAASPAPAEVWATGR